MARKVFFSFHYAPDKWRASQVRNMGVLEGDAPVADNDWERIKRGGDDAIQKWIHSQMSGKSCTVVLVGTETASRRWVRYEIMHAWNQGKGVVAIHIHNLKDENQTISLRGPSPFAGIDIKTHSGQKEWLSNVAKLHDPQGATSKETYATIATNIGSWVEDAIRIRAQYP